MESRTGWVRAEVGAGGRTTIDAGGTRVAVFVVDGRPYAVANACPHAGNPLVEGDVLGPTLVCAFHGWRFDLATGACILGDEAVRAYPAELDDGEVWVQVDAAI